MTILARSKTLLLGTALALFLGATAGLAHHSTSGFNEEEVIRIQGTITQFRWTNPHASIKMNGVIEGEEETVWTIEMTAPNVLINQGWQRNSLEEGDNVVIYGNPMRDPDFRLRDGSKGALYVGAELADGSTLGSVDGS